MIFFHLASCRIIYKPLHKTMDGDTTQRFALVTHGPIGLCLYLPSSSFWYFKEDSLFFYSHPSRLSLWSGLILTHAKLVPWCVCRLEGRLLFSPTLVIHSHAYFFISLTSALRKHAMIIILLVTWEFTCTSLYRSLGCFMNMVGFLCFLLILLKIWKWGDSPQPIVLIFSWRHSEKRLCSLWLQSRLQPVAIWEGKKKPG